MLIVKSTKRAQFMPDGNYWKISYQVPVPEGLNREPNVRLDPIAKKCGLLCTMNPDEDDHGGVASFVRRGDTVGREIKDGGLFARGGVIEAVGPTADLPSDADLIIDMSGHVRQIGMWWLVPITNHVARIITHI